MRQISTGELSRMKITASESFNDSCSITSITITGTTLGEDATTESTSNNIPCGFVEGNTYRSSRGELITFDADAILRLALSQAIDSSDEVTVRGNTYKIQGINVGRTVKMIPLKRIESSDG